MGWYDQRNILETEQLFLIFFMILAHLHDTSLLFALNYGPVLTFENILLLEPCHEAWTKVIVGISDNNPYSTIIEPLQTCGKGIGAKVSKY